MPPHGPRRLALGAGVLLLLAGFCIEHADAPSLHAGGTKPNNDGSLSGVADIWVGQLAGQYLFFHCIALMDHDASTNDIKAALQCYSDIDISDPQAGNYVASIPGEGTDANNDGLEDRNGAPPPPPYTVNPPAKGYGALDGGGTATLAACFPNLGGTAGPNIVATLSIPNAKAQRAKQAPDVGMVDIYFNQSSDACASLTPESAPSLSNASVFVLNVAEGTVSPWRAIGDGDIDNDDCTDAEELEKDARPKGCGDDPWNPGDSAPSTDDLSGSYELLATVLPADMESPVYAPANTEGPDAGPCDDTLDNDSDTLTDDADPDCNAPGPVVSGYFHECLAELQHDTGTNGITARLFCYVDSSSVTINPELTGQTSCPPAAAVFCGDGLAGSGPPPQPPPPSGPAETGLQCLNAADDDNDTFANDGCPGVFADVNTRHVELAGSVDEPSNVISLRGCFEDVDGQSQLGHMYWDLAVERDTGRGTVDIWTNQSLAECTGGTPTGPPASSPLDIVRQNNMLGVQGRAPDLDDNRDTDGDGCSDLRELAGGQNPGGLRDPFNPWDYFEPTGNGQARAADISAVVAHFFLDYQGSQPGYSTRYDRVGLIGANAWNFGTPNLQIRAADISAAVKSFFMDCGNDPRASRIED